MSSEFSLIIRSIDDKLVPGTESHITQQISAIDDFTRLLPILIATATLLAMVNIRNSEISARFRANGKEYRDNATSQERKKNLACQNRMFYFRYIASCVSFLCLAFALLCFALFGAGRISGNAMHNDAIFNFNDGLFSLFLGISIFAIEFVFGFFTLRRDGRDVKIITNYMHDDEQHSEPTS